MTHDCSPASAATDFHADGGDLRNGVYRVDMSDEFLRAHHLSDADVLDAHGVFTWRLRDGHWSVDQANDTPQGPTHGEGIYQVVTNKEKALAITNQRLKQKNLALVEEAYRFYGPIFSFPPRVSHDGVRVVLEMIAQRNPGTKAEMNVDKYVDERLLDELEREGLFQRISGKG